MLDVSKPSSNKDNACPTIVSSLIIDFDRDRMSRTACMKSVLRSPLASRWLTTCRIIDRSHLSTSAGKNLKYFFFHTNLFAIICCRLYICCTYANLMNLFRAGVNIANIVRIVCINDASKTFREFFTNADSVSANASASSPNPHDATDSIVNFEQSVRASNTSLPFRFDSCPMYFTVLSQIAFTSGNTDFTLLGVNTGEICLRCTCHWLSSENDGFFERIGSSFSSILKSLLRKLLKFSTRIDFNRTRSRISMDGVPNL